jgi:hypothetical protein
MGTLLVKTACTNTDIIYSTVDERVKIEWHQTVSGQQKVHFAVNPSLPHVVMLRCLYVIQHLQIFVTSKDHK